VARTDEAGQWRFLGLLPLFDPPRDDCIETIATIRKMGVDIKMVTGDHEAIAKQIAGRLNLGQNIVAASTARRIFDHRRKKTFATQSASGGH
jgi:H+-transporting ATPase